MVKGHVNFKNRVERDAHSKSWNLNLHGNIVSIITTMRVHCTDSKAVYSTNFASKNTFCRLSALLCAIEFSNVRESKRSLHKKSDLELHCGYGQY